MLDEYRLSFGEPFGIVIKAISERLRLQPTGRPAKTTQSIVQKLQREKIRLTQIQDIAGCRLVVPRVLDQDRAVASLREVFPDAHVMDRRANPSHGYRAVHVIVEISGKTIEIQVRTDFQHLWAEVSEKLSDVLDPTIKYGGGDEDTRKMLDVVSKSVENNEAIQRQIDDLGEKIDAFSTAKAVDLTGEKLQIEKLREAMLTRQEQVSKPLRDVLGKLSSLRKRQ